LLSLSMFWTLLMMMILLLMLSMFLSLSVMLLLMLMLFYSNILAQMGVRFPVRGRPKLVWTDRSNVEVTKMIWSQHIRSNLTTHISYSKGLKLAGRIEKYMNYVFKNQCIWKISETTKYFFKNPHFLDGCGSRVWNPCLEGFQFDR